MPKQIDYSVMTVFYTDRQAFCPRRENPGNPGYIVVYLLCIAYCLALADVPQMTHGRPVRTCGSRP